MKPHSCHDPKTCCCNTQGLEPSDDCPVHGHPWPPRCEECGRFLPWTDWPMDAVEPETFEEAVAAQRTVEG